MEEENGKVDLQALGIDEGADGLSRKKRENFFSSKETRGPCSSYWMRMRKGWSHK